VWGLGLRYRKNVQSLPGKPDLVFPTARVAVFCDGDFWHGRQWRKLRRQLARGTNARYWLAKIRANMRRDAATTAELRRIGWKVIRVWEREIFHDPHRIAVRIKRIVDSRSNPKTRR
jgi:DNA mismatch endonuclease (patch repair protein)